MAIEFNQNNACRCHHTIVSFKLKLFIVKVGLIKNMIYLKKTEVNRESIDLAEIHRQWCSKKMSASLLFSYVSEGIEEPDFI